MERSCELGRERGERGDVAQRPAAICSRADGRGKLIEQHAMARLLEAELVISAEMAATTAREAGTNPNAELILYLVHGLLHLCGFDDRDDASADVMRSREAEVLQREGWDNTFPMIGPPGQRSEPCRA